MQKRKANPRQRYCSSPFSGKILCGDCGCVYGSKVWHSTDQYRRVIWQCNGKFKGDEKCTTPHLTETQIRDAFREAVSKLIPDRTALLEDGRIIKDALTDCTGIEKKLNEIGFPYPHKHIAYEHMSHAVLTRLPWIYKMAFKSERQHPKD